MEEKVKNALLFEDNNGECLHSWLQHLLQNTATEVRGWFGAFKLQRPSLGRGLCGGSTQEGNSLKIDMGTFVPKLPSHGDLENSLRVLGARVKRLKLEFLVLVTPFIEERERRRDLE